MSHLELDELRQAMSRVEVTWEFGETGISGFLSSESTSLFGLAVGEAGRHAAILDAFSGEGAQALGAAPPPPTAIDWRSFNGANWVSDVRNQSTCGSCVAFATCAVLESRLKLSEGDPTLSTDLSEAHLFFCGAGPACDTGWHFDPALQFCRDTGVGQESDFPYSPANQSCDPISPIVGVSSWRLEASTLARKQAVAQNGPVIAGMRVFEDFYYYRGGVYRHVAGAARGQHAIAVIGYDDQEQAWIAKNSWGTNWGERGFFRIGYGECGIDSSYPYYDPDVVYPYPIP